MSDIDLDGTIERVLHRLRLCASAPHDGNMVIVNVDWLRDGIDALVRLRGEVAALPELLAIVQRIAALNADPDVIYDTLHCNFCEVHHNDDETFTHEAWCPWVRSLAVVGAPLPKGHTVR